MSIVPVGIGPALPLTDGPAPAVATPTGPGRFTELVDRLLAGANGQQLQADHAVQELAAGRSDNIHNVMLSVAKADLSFRLVLEVRNRLAEAYQEIMRMQV